jgi:ribosomal protein S6--L-glutamate ligase
MKIGVVGTHGGWSSEFLADSVQDKTGFRLLVDMADVSLDLDGCHVWHGQTDLCSLDGLIIKKIGARYSPDLLDRLELLRFVQNQGVKIYSSPLNIMRVLDRLSCTVTLRLAGIPMPPTTITENATQAVRTVHDYGQAVFKPLYTSKARGMKLITADSDIERQVQEYHRHNSIMYIQKKIDLDGRDLGLVFLGGSYLTTYSRRLGHSWNTTTANGGKYEPFTPSGESIRLAEKAQSLFGLDFTCVDLVETAQGPVVFEVSAFGGFRGVFEAQNINAAALLTDYVIERIRA